MLPKFLNKKKIVSIFLSFFFISSLLSQSTQAFYTPNATYQFQFEQAVKSEEMNLQSYVYETTKAVIGSIVHTSLGPYTYTPEQGGGAGLVNTIGSFIALIYTTPPASGIQYLADIGRRLNIAQPIYAQGEGLGFRLLGEPYRVIWTAFRNITYVFFVLILVIMGFAIMFRIKISPQTVISIQSALPRVVIALILITFSYAIVGLLVDFMFVLSNLIIFTFKNMPNIDQHFPQWIANIIVPNRPITSTPELAFGILVLVLGPFFALTLVIMALGAVPTLALATNPFTAGLIPGMHLFVLLVLAIIFLVIYARILWTLLRAYVMVVIHLIFGPFQILIGVLPGSNAITSWLRNLIANLVVLPAVLAMLFISGYIALSSLFKETAGGIGPAVVNFIGGGDRLDIIKSIADALGNLSPLGIADLLIPMAISIGILALTPRVSDMIKAFLAGRPFEYGAAIGEAFGPITRPVAGLTGFGISIGRDLARTAAAQQIFGERGETVSSEGRGRIPRAYGSKQSQWRPNYERLEAARRAIERSRREQGQG